MKERPILFSTPMVHAILQGRKTVTRRLVRKSSLGRIDVTPAGVPVYVTGASDDGGDPIPCPYGEPGDRLWVRETWRRSMGRDGFDYRASAEWPRMGPAWKPSIHMPRRASRLTLEVVSTRVERLHDITDEEVFAEGLDLNPAGTFYVEDGEDELAEFAEPRDAFAFLWDGINGKRAEWDSNPWVWRVEFRRMP